MLQHSKLRYVCRLSRAIATIRADLTRLSIRDDVLDSILCFRVLEHIVDDAVA